MRTIILSLLMLTTCGTAVKAQEPVATVPVVQETLRFGYLSYNEVLQAMPDYEKATEQIKQLRTAYEQELQRSEEMFSKAYAEYVEGQQTFPENILLKRQKELQQLMEQSMQFKQEARQLLEENENSVMQPLQERLDEAINQVGMNQKLAFIVNTDNHTYPFINAGIGTNVSAEVLKLLK